MNETAYYWLGGIGAWIATLWMAERFIKARVFDVIDEAKHIAQHAEESVTRLEISIAKSNGELRQEMLAQVIKISDLFSECSALARDAKKEAWEVKELLRSKKLPQARKNGHLIGDK